MGKRFIGIFLFFSANSFKIKKPGGNLFNDEQVQIVQDSKCICIIVITWQVGEKQAKWTKKSINQRQESWKKKRKTQWFAVSSNNDRSSHPEVFFKRYSQKCCRFCWHLFFDNVAAPQTATLIKMRHRIKWLDFLMTLPLLLILLFINIIKSNNVIIIITTIIAIIILLLLLLVLLLSILLLFLFSPLLTTTFLLFLLRDHNENKAFCLFCIIPAI